jgi:prepilin-type N-terminal cleavage/methylation domain-containing protein
MNKSAQGFTLIELTIVLFIVSLLLGGILGPLSTRMEVEERNKTELQLEEIKDSLVGFALVNGYLPCPDCDSTSGNCGSAGLTADDGVEDGVGGGAGVSPRTGNTFESCAIAEGNLPWVTLGLAETDAWGNRFKYRVDETYADDVDGTNETDCELTAGMSFQICSSGNITVNNASGTLVADELPFTVISFGANTNDEGNPSSTAETENQDSSNSLFIDTNYSKVAANQFDDLLIWIPNNTLIYRMVQAEKLP